MNAQILPYKTALIPLVMNLFLIGLLFFLKASMPIIVLLLVNLSRMFYLLFNLLGKMPLYLEGIKTFSSRDLKILFCNVLMYISSQITTYAIFYKYFGIRDMVEGGKLVSDASTSLYFSVITITTVGYGDFAPTSGFCRFLACAEALTGYSILAMTTSTFPLYFKNFFYSATDRTKNKTG